MEYATTTVVRSRDGSRTVSRQKATQTALQNLTDAGRAAERTAVAGWQELADAFDTAAGRTQDLAGDARTRVSDLRKQAGKRSKQARKRADEARQRSLDAKDEAYRRSTAARDALAGRQSHTWRWVIVAAAAGLGAGAAVAQFGRKLIKSREQAQLEKIEQTVADSTAGESVRVNGYPVDTGPAAATTTSTGAGASGATNSAAPTPPDDKSTTRKASSTE
jgi:hypothetical protein